MKWKKEFQGTNKLLNELVSNKAVIKRMNEKFKNIFMSQDPMNELIDNMKFQNSKTCF